MPKVTVTKESLTEIVQEVVNISQLNKLVDNIVDMVIDKNHDYGNAWQTYGIFTPLIRINDKLLRVKNLSGGEQALVADEKVEDNLRDVVGYALLALLWLDNNPFEFLKAENCDAGRSIEIETMVFCKNCSTMYHTIYHFFPSECPKLKK